jgi:aminobenzoyl-glutamate transport protein
MSTTQLSVRGAVGRVLGWVERLGNALPHPATLFAVLAMVVVVLSWLGAALGVAVVNPATGREVAATSLLNVAGLHRMLVGAVPNFVGFPPLGTVLVCLLGLAVAERAGLVGAGLRWLVLTAPRRWLTPMVVFAGVLSNAGGDVGYVLLVPLAAGMFHAVGRHPLAGLAAAFAGVSGGFSANLLVGAVDVMLVGITQAAAEAVAPEYAITPFANYYFLLAATFLVTALGTWVTERVVEPRLGGYTGTVAPVPLAPLAPLERRGLACALGITLVFAAVVSWGVVPVDGFLRDPENSDFFASYFVRGLVAFIFLAGLLSGLAYGLAAGTLRSDHEVARGMEGAMATMASYLVMAFFAAQFIAYFNWTHLGTITAVAGAEAIRGLGLQNSPVVLMVALVVFTALVNLVMGSASAKWALLAPIFVPMFYLLGYSPELVQGAYRVGDSVTNIVTPLMAYFPLVLTFAQRYEPRAGIGTMVATMLPYSLCFLVGWTLLLGLWILLGWPMGPGAPLMVGR